MRIWKYLDTLYLIPMVHLMHLVFILLKILLRLRKTLLYHISIWFHSSANTLNILLKHFKLFTMTRTFGAATETPIHATTTPTHLATNGTRPPLPGNWLVARQDNWGGLRVGGGAMWRVVGHREEHHLRTQCSIFIILCTFLLTQFFHSSRIRKSRLLFYVLNNWNMWSNFLVFLRFAVTCKLNHLLFH